MATDNPGLLSATSATASARQRIIAAFNALVLDRQRGPYRVGNIARRAGVARSTFYDHFASESALQLTALSVPFAAMADALTGCAGSDVLARWLQHFWEHRQQARPLLSGMERARIEAAFVSQIMARLHPGVGDPAPEMQVQAVQIAAGTLAIIGRWLGGRLPIAAAALADQCITIAAAIRINPTVD